METRALRVVEDHLGRACFNHAPLVHEDHLIGDAAGKAHFMGDDDHGHTALAEVGHQIENALDQFRVERTRHLVEENDFRLHGEGARNGDALLLAAGEAAGPVMLPERTALDAVFNSNIPMPEGVISPVKLTQALDAILPDDAIVTAEPGVSAIFPSALLSLKKAGRRYITNYSMGALGYSVPAGICAAFANDGPIISFTGDGSLAFVLGDFETIRRSGKNITVILTRNDTYGWIRGEAVLLDNVDVPWTTEFGAVDYIKVAEGFGFRTARITSEAEIEATLREAIAHPGASFIEIMVPSQDKIIPFVPAWVRVAKERNLPYFS